MTSGAGREKGKTMDINGITVETFEHPELGLVLADNSGAAGEPGSNAFAGHQWPPSALIQTLLSMRRADDIPVIASTYASDGWWWYPIGNWRQPASNGGNTTAFEQAQARESAIVRAVANIRNRIGPGRWCGEVDGVRYYVLEKVQFGELSYEARIDAPHGPRVRDSCD